MSVKQTADESSELSAWHQELLHRGHIVMTDKTCTRKGCTCNVLDMGVEVNNIYDDDGWKVGVTERSVFECTGGHTITEQEMENIE